jgi:hypothetical protein
MGTLARGVFKAHEADPPTGTARKRMGSRGRPMTERHLGSRAASPLSADEVGHRFLGVRGPQPIVAAVPEFRR